MANRTDVYRIPIDKDGKQILVVTGAEFHAEHWDMFLKGLYAFMDSDDPVYAIHVAEGVKVELVTVTKRGRRG